MAHVFIGIGSNAGDRHRSIRDALKRLRKLADDGRLRMAPVAETDPVGGPTQGPYLNTVATFTTSREPRALLQALKRIEGELGRTPSATRWGPRPIDLDLLLYDDRIMTAPDCTIPHPRLHERRFVLEPLAQLSPDTVHPILRQSVAMLRNRLCRTDPQPGADTIPPHMT